MSRFTSALCLALASSASSAESSRVKHLVILMMENHSFDNMLGWMKRQNPEIDGLDGTQCNKIDPSDASSKNVCVTDQGSRVDPDPSHSLSGTAFEVYGTPTVSAEDEHNPERVTMGGFVATEIENNGEVNWG